LSKINLFFLFATTLSTFTPRPNPHSPRPRQRATSRRDFVLWRFSAAGRFSAWKVLRLPAAETLTKLSHN